MIGRVHGRRQFAALRRHGKQRRRGSLAVVYHAGSAKMPCLALAVGRRVGNAVVRNRARRQLRAAFAQVATASPEIVPPGNYLVSVEHADWSFDQARSWIRQALESLLK